MWSYTVEFTVDEMSTVFRRVFVVYDHTLLVISQYTTKYGHDSGIIYTIVYHVVLLNLGLSRSLKFIIGKYEGKMF